MTENRHFHRIHFDCQVEFEVGDDRHVCELFDISLKGALIGNCADLTATPGTQCRLILTLDKSSGAQIIMDGSIAHNTENRVGIHCQSIDVDSMMQLRRLVELNLGDSDLLQRDLDALLGDESPQS